MSLIQQLREIFSGIKAIVLHWSELKILLHDLLLKGGTQIDTLYIYQSQANATGSTPAEKVFTSILQLDGSLINILPAPETLPDYQRDAQLQQHAQLHFQRIAQHCAQLQGLRLFGQGVFSSLGSLAGLLSALYTDVQQTFLMQVDWLQANPWVASLLWISFLMLGGWLFFIHLLRPLFLRVLLQALRKRFSKNVA